MATVVIDVLRCKGCGLCIEVCPRKMLVRAGQISGRGVYPVEAADPASCTGCLQCVLVCPDVAITIADAGTPRQARKRKQ